MNQEEANKVIAEKLEQIKALIEECKSLASEHECHFDYSLLTEDELDELKKDFSGWSASDISCY